MITAELTQFSDDWLCALCVCRNVVFVSGFPSSCLFQILVEPSDRLLQPIGLVRGINEHMAFAGIND